jgi:pilus assembly protein CpaF
VIPAGTYQTSIRRFLTPISSLLDDPEVTEIMVNGPSNVWIERQGTIERTTCNFQNEASLTAALTNIAQFAGRPLGWDRPILEAHLPDGSRVEAVLPPLADGGPVVSIRRFSESTLTMEQLIAFGSLTAPAALFLGRAVRARQNILISGGTGTGKTSLLGAMSSLVRDNERIVVIEDTREVKLQKPHVVYLETRSSDERGRGRITIRDLLRATLRLRPDRIVVGEVRGKEALDLLQAMTSGHGGSMTTTHANTPKDALRRIETMALMDDIDMPLSALRAQVASAVHMVVQVERTSEGQRRVSTIAKVGDLTPAGEYTVRTLFRLDSEGRLIWAPSKKARSK